MRVCAETSQESCHQIDGIWADCSKELKATCGARNDRAYCEGQRSNSTTNFPWIRCVGSALTCSDRLRRRETVHMKIIMTNTVQPGVRPQVKSQDESQTARANMRIGQFAF